MLAFSFKNLFRGRASRDLPPPVAMCVPMVKPVAYRTFEAHPEALIVFQRTTSYPACGDLAGFQCTGTCSEETDCATERGHTHLHYCCSACGGETLVRTGGEE